MPPANRLAHPFPEEPCSFRMPIEPADYFDRSPVLSEEERRGIAYLLQLAPSRYLEFDRQASVLSRVTQPLMDEMLCDLINRPQLEMADECYQVPSIESMRPVLHILAA